MYTFNDNIYCIKTMSEKVAQTSHNNPKTSATEAFQDRLASITDPVVDPETHLVADTPSRKLYKLTQEVGNEAQLAKFRAGLTSRSIVHIDGIAKFRPLNENERIELAEKRARLPQLQEAEQKTRTAAETASRVAKIQHRLFKTALLLSAIPGAVIPWAAINYTLSPSEGLGTYDGSILPNNTDEFIIPGVNDIPGSVIKGYQTKEGVTYVTQPTTSELGGGVQNPDAPNFQLPPSAAEADKQVADKIIEDIKLKGLHISRIVVTGSTSDEVKGPGSGLGVTDIPNIKLAEKEAELGAKIFKDEASKAGLSIETVVTTGSEKVLDTATVDKIDEAARALGQTREQILAAYKSHNNTLPVDVQNLLHAALDNNRNINYTVTATGEQTVPQKTTILEQTEKKIPSLPGELFMALPSIGIGLLTGLMGAGPLSRRVNRLRAKQTVAKARKTPSTREN